MATVEVRRYQTTDGRIPVTAWLDGLRDRAARFRIVARLDRLTENLRGDWKSLGGGVSTSCGSITALGTGFTMPRMGSL
jgi:putative component of toxin-antitoxin plasmid stabilization module